MLATALLLATIASGTDTYPIRLGKRAEYNETIAAITTHYSPVVNLTVGTPGVTMPAALDFFSGDTLVEHFVPLATTERPSFWANESRTLTQGDPFKFKVPLSNVTLNATIAHDTIAIGGVSSQNTSFCEWEPLSPG